MKRGVISHPKTLHLADLLKLRPYAAVGILECLTHWAARYTIQGDIGKYPNAVIARGVEWDGDADVLISALVDSGFLDQNPEHRLVIHDIQQHADNTWKQNLEDAGLTWWDGSPARSPYGKKKKKTVSTSRELQEDIKETSSIPPQPVSSIQYPVSFSCAEPRNGSAPAAVTVEEIFLEFPVVGIGGPTWGLTKSKAGEYHATYGRNIDVKDQLRRARQWVNDNPKNRKTAAGMPRFLNSWLARAADGRGTL